MLVVSSGGLVNLRRITCVPPLDNNPFLHQTKN
ncbi:P7 protein [Rose spring dwarf-associated virus]|uniref:p7 protein n=1 Tax=Rose spring dwarf-associated virus TaxID=474454 RepID=B3FHC4_9TOMB|nr:P7 protein [Rose spring dwarf-associated virus]ABV89771.1 P7 protein [Rose spring dwarf-associated virus]